MEGKGENGCSGERKYALGATCSGKRVELKRVKKEKTKLMAMERRARSKKIRRGREERIQGREGEEMDRGEKRR